MIRRILLIGATGFFGERLASRLALVEGIELLLASRSDERASRLVERLRPASRCSLGAVAFDRAAPEAPEQLRTLAPFLVIDASGPFQGASHDLARQAIAAGAHWIDLADARDYILGFGAALDVAARDAGRVAFTGASTTPALTRAVVSAMTRDWQRVDAIDIAILPGGKGRVGLSVIRAILNYCGAPVREFREGQFSDATGWGRIGTVQTASLSRRWVSPVETADADLLAREFSVASRVTASAGLQSQLEQLALRALASLRRRGLVSNLQGCAGVLRRMRGLTALFSSDRGGMIVDCAGIDSKGHQICARWWLDAKPGWGPEVPVLPALALARKILAGDFAGGGQAAVANLSLDEIDAEMNAPAITTSRHLVRSGASGLFASTTTGHLYASLPARLRDFHAGTGAPVWRGEADVEVARNPVAYVVRKHFGFPEPGSKVPITVSVDRSGADETWTRNFNGRRFSSLVSPVAPGIVAERFGLMRILLRLDIRDEQISMPVLGASVGRLPLPRFLAPESGAREFADGTGRFNFDVSINLPLFGTLAHYRGWLEPAASPFGKESEKTIDAARA